MDRRYGVSVQEPEEMYVRNRDAEVKVLKDYRVFTSGKKSEAEDFLKWLREHPNYERLQVVPPDKDGEKWEIRYKKNDES